jgi:hypothetical protein
MRAELRPSNLGEILDRTAHMYRGNFLLYLGIAAVAYAFVVVLKLPDAMLLFGPLRGYMRHHPAINGIILLLINMLSLLPISIGAAAVMRAVARNYLGESTTVAGSYAAIRPHWSRYLLILLAIYVYSLVPFAVALGLAVAGITLVPAGAARTLVIFLEVLLGIAGGVFLIRWMLGWALAIPAALMEDLTVHRGLQRSRSLTRGSIGRIFVMLLLVGILMTFVQYAVLTPMFVVFFKSRGHALFWTQVLGTLGGALGGTFVLPVYSIALTLFYYDVRIRKEGFDVEWLMQQAGLDASAAGEPAASRTPISPQPEPPATAP